MSLHSILYERIEDNPAGETLEAPSFFIDLNLDQVIDAVTAGRQEYNLKPFFYAFPRNKNTVLYRQEIARDLEDDTLMDAVKSFSAEMRMMRRYLAMLGELHYRYHIEGWFLEAAHVYLDAVFRLAQAVSTMELRSRGLSEFRAYLTQHVRSERFTAFRMETNNLKADLASIQYCVIINGNRVDVRKYDSETDYSAEVEATFIKFRQGAVKDYRKNLAYRSGMHHVEAAILDRVARLHPDIFARLDNYFGRNRDFPDETIRAFDREIQFYVAYLDFTAKLNRARLSFCYPRISDRSKDVYDYKGFDIALANRRVAENSPIVCNDFHLKGPERIIVVSGPNQGGKTTFARTFG